MNPTDSISQAADTIQKGTSGVIVLPVNPSADAVAAATALYLSLTKMGKNVNIVCDSDVKSDLIATDKIQPELTTSGDNLVISFPYTEGSIDKVDYNILTDTFNLIVTPRPGQPKLDPEKVRFSYAGGAVHFIITVDAPNLNSLGRIYTENKNQFQGKSMVNIDRHLVNDFFGTVNIVNKTSSSTSELVLRFLRDINVEIDRDTATNLYAGIMSATNNFTSYAVNADTFEAAATLLKAGAVKKQMIKKSDMPMNQPQQPQRPQSQQFTPQQRRPMNVGVKPQPKPQMVSNEQQIRPIEMVEQEVNANGTDESQDWLKPRIFKGTGLL